MCVTLRYDVRFYLWRRQLCLKLAFDEVVGTLTSELATELTSELTSELKVFNAYCPLGFVFGYL